MDDIINTTCEFSDPVYWNKKIEELVPATEEIDAGDNWNYSKMICSGTSTEIGISTFDKTFELFENEETGTEFYLDKTIDYGDLFIGFFLLLFLIFGTFWFFVDFLIPKFMNFKR